MYAAVPFAVTQIIQSFQLKVLYYLQSEEMWIVVLQN